MSEIPKLLNVLSGKTIRPQPIWMMRQAGRHLPEYMAVRATTKNFIEFCLTPDKASEVTIQPINRYDMDAAILFADILLIPLAMGRRVDFIKGQGPDLDPISVSEIDHLADDMDLISNVFQTVKSVRSKLDPLKALIGFCGAPWTVATYMIEGKGTPKKEKAKRFAYEHPEAMDSLLNQLADLSALYMIEQAKAGADVLKIFESWAEGLSPYLFDKLVIRPTQRMIDHIRAAGVTVPIMGFPRGAGLNVSAYHEKVAVNCVALGTDVNLLQAREQLGLKGPIQGNLDPLALRIGGQTLKDAVDRVLLDASGPHIFNLGHGVSPDVKIANIEAVVSHIRTGSGDYVPGDML